MNHVEKWRAARAWCAAVAPPGAHWRVVEVVEISEQAGFLYDADGFLAPRFKSWSEESGLYWMRLAQRQKCVDAFQSRRQVTDSVDRRVAQRSARLAHNQEVGGSNPPPATISQHRTAPTPWTVDRKLLGIRDADGRVVLSFLTMPNRWDPRKREAILRQVAACVNVCGAIDVAELEGIVVAGRTIEVALRASLAERQESEPGPDGGSVLPFRGEAR